MKNIDEIKNILQGHKKEIQDNYGVIILGIFGSYARNEADEDSNIDILIDLEKPLGFKYFELWEYLEKLLNCKVDLVRAKLVHERLKESIFDELVSI